MALIQCPECGGNVSDTCDVCVHCGFNLSDYIKNNTYYDLILRSEYKGVARCIGPYPILHSVCKVPEDRAHELLLRKDSTLLAGLSWKSAQYLIWRFSTQDCIVEAVKSDKPYQNPRNAVYEECYDEKFGPVVCPVCGSDQIVTGQRGYSLVWGFLGSNSTTNRCAQCGHSWKP